jgi:hypothetical protein
MPTRTSTLTRSRPSSNDGRAPLNRAIAPNARVRRHGPVQRPALSKSAALVARHPLLWRDGTTAPNHERGQTEPTRPGRVGRGEGRLRRTLAFGADWLPPGGGDRQIADGSAVNPWHCSIGESICVYLRDLRAIWVGGRLCAPFLCLCASVSLWFYGWVFPVVSRG